MPVLSTCNEPQCPVRDPGVDSHVLAEWIVQLLAGERPTLSSPIRPSERCVDCVEHVLRGTKPLPTDADVERALVEGRRAYRRSRRGIRREAHGVD